MRKGDVVLMSNPTLENLGIACYPYGIVVRVEDTPHGPREASIVTQHGASYTLYEDHLIIAPRAREENELCS